MRKSILSIALCLVLLLSMSTTAFAADTVNGDTQATVKGSYSGPTEAETVYRVDITWGSLAFTYEVPAQVWDPDTHQYKDGEGEARWVCTTDEDETTVDANEVRVTNYSNADVAVTVTTDMGETGITATVTGEAFTLGSADATITAENTTGTATFGSATIALSGELASDHTAGGEIGKLTVTLAQAPTNTEPSDPEAGN